MAPNEIFEPVGKLYIEVPSGTTTGEPVVLGGAIPGVALTDRDADGKATVAINPAWVFDMPVKGEFDLANVAIAQFDRVYLDTDGELNHDASNGTLFGIALEAVASGVTSTIRVLLAPPGAFEWTS